MQNDSVAWSRASTLAVSCLVAGLALVSLASHRRAATDPAITNSAPPVTTDVVAEPPSKAPEPGRAAIVTQARELREGRPINVNLASADELRLLPGIGPTLAQRIVESRAKHGPFANVRQLTRVHGIGPKTVARVTTLLVATDQSWNSQPSESVTAR